MPELPEVETTRRALVPLLIGCRIKKVIVRQEKLRWPVPKELITTTEGSLIQNVERRAKYLLIRLKPKKTILFHLGMSGRLCVIPNTIQAAKHDHIDINFDNNQVLRFTDPRRFGSCLIFSTCDFQHPLLDRLVPEPLGQGFTDLYLYKSIKGRKASIKSLLMNSQIVSGLGNIYVNEVLFKAGVRPRKPAGRISKKQCTLIVSAVFSILNDALIAGGTSLRDFRNPKGEYGYFKQNLSVYGREGKSCPKCNEIIITERIGQRSTFFCKTCQT